MPKNTVQCGNKTYLWNFEKEQFEEVIISTVPIPAEKIPIDVIKELMALVGRKVPKDSR